MRVSVLKTGVLVALVVGLVHLFWAALVALHYAQDLINFVLGLHFLAIDMRVTPFDPVVAAILVGFTAGCGFVVGAVLAVIWNSLHPNTKAT